MLVLFTVYCLLVKCVLYGSLALRIEYGMKFEACREKLQETKCQMGISSFSVSASVSSSLVSESTMSFSIYIPDVGRGSCLGESSTRINLNTQNK